MDDNARKKILFTRPIREKEKKWLTERKFEVVDIPFISTMEMSFSQPELNQLLEYNPSFIVLSSPRVIPFYLRYYEAGCNRPVYTNSVSVANCLEKENLPYVLKKGYAADLAEFILKKLPVPGKGIFFCSQVRQKDVKTILSAGGMELLEVPVYKTTIHHHQLKVPYDAVVFMSPSAVKGFYAKNNSEGKQVFAIGKTTASEIKKFKPGPVQAPKNPGILSLLDCIYQFYQ